MMKRLSLAIIFACCALAMAAQEQYRTGESQPEGWTITVVTGQCGQSRMVATVKFATFGI